MALVTEGRICLGQHRGGLPLLWKLVYTKWSGSLREGCVSLLTLDNILICPEQVDILQTLKSKHILYETYIHFP